MGIFQIIQLICLIFKKKKLNKDTAMPFCFPEEAGTTLNKEKILNSVECK